VKVLSLAVFFTDIL